MSADRRHSAHANGKDRIVAIAASTGGPAALETVLHTIGAEFEFPILVVQHMMPAFVNEFAQWLRQIAPLDVRIAEDGEPLRGGCVYLAPENVHLEVSKPGVVSLSDDPPCGYHRPSASRMFASIAEHYGEGALAVVLTGMGNDGLDGVHELHARGGRVIAQDEDSCVVYGMPGAVVGADLAHEILPLRSIGTRIARLMNADLERKGADASHLGSPQ